MRIVSNGHPDQPSFPQELMTETDPHVLEQVFEDDRIYEASVKAYEDFQSSPADPPEATSTPTSEDPEVILPEPVIETPIQEPDPATPENPFLKAGMSQEVYDKLVAEGNIKDGKLHGRFDPESPSFMQDFFQYYVNDYKLRGKLSAEVGNVRKKADQLETNLQETTKELSKERTERLAAERAKASLEKELQDIRQSVDRKIKPSGFVYEDAPAGLQERQLEVVRELANRQTKEDLQSKFKAYGQIFPETEADWELLRTEAPDLHATAIARRDQNFDQKTRWALGAIEINKNYSNLKEKAYTEASLDLVQFLNDQGIPVDEDSPEVREVLKDAIAGIENVLGKITDEDSVNPAMFRLESGLPLPTAASIRNYLAQYKPEVYAKLVRGDFRSAEPVETLQIEPSETATQQEERVPLLAEALERFHNYVNRFQENLANDIEWHGSDLQAAVEFISQHSEDPRFVANGLLREDAIVNYFATEKPEYLSNLLRQNAQKEYEAKLKEQADELAKNTQNALLERNARANDFLQTAASDANGATSKTGATFTLPTPEQMKDPLYVQKAARQMFPKETADDAIDSFWDFFDSKIKEIQDPNIRKQYFT